MSKFSGFNEICNWNSICKFNFIAKFWFSAAIKIVWSFWLRIIRYTFKKYFMP